MTFHNRDVVNFLSQKRDSHNVQDVILNVDVILLLGGHFVLNDLLQYPRSIDRPLNCVYATGYRYITNMYCLAVKAGFYGDAVECWICTFKSLHMKKKNQMTDCKEIH